MANKIKPTFDQVYRTFYYNKILEMGIGQDEFKIINDSSQFQEDDELENFTIVMITTYGGEKSSIRGLEATNLNLQILVNTDQPQKWKMIIDQINDQVNGDWEPLIFNETEDYEARSFQFFQTLNSSNVVKSAATQVATSSRHTVQVNGNIFYSNKRFDLGVEVYFKIDQEYKKASYLVSKNFGMASENISYSEVGVETFKNVDKGLVRQFTFSFILDDENEVHQFIFNNFLDGISEAIEMKLYIANLEVEKEFDVLISDLKIMGDIGQNGAIEITLIESGF